MTIPWKSIVTIVVIVAVGAALSLLYSWFNARTAVTMSKVDRDLTQFQGCSSDDACESVQALYCQNVISINKLQHKNWQNQDTALYREQLKNKEKCEGSESDKEPGNFTPVCEQARCGLKRIHF